MIIFISYPLDSLDLIMFLYYFGFCINYLVVMVYLIMVVYMFYDDDDDMILVIPKGICVVLSI